MERFSERSLLRTTQRLIQIISGGASDGDAVEIVTLTIGVVVLEGHWKKSLVTKIKTVLSHRLPEGSVTDDDNWHEGPKSVDDQLARGGGCPGGDDDQTRHLECLCWIFKSKSLVAERVFVVVGELDKNPRYRS